nr:hypothetical protein CFP56_27473 [Quercus suber]
MEMPTESSCGVVQYDVVGLTLLLVSMKLTSMWVSTTFLRDILRERVINRLRKRNETLTNEQDQYKGALCTLNKEVTAFTKKLEAHLQEKEQEAKVNQEKELMTLSEFEDCLKQVKFVYPNLDLSRVTMDDPLQMTPARDDIVNEETNDSTESERDSKDDSVILAQVAIEGPVVPQAPSTDDPLTHDASNNATQDSPNSSA